jgi:hypothetical protein
MDEDEYDALPAEEKHRIDQKRLQQKKDRILRYEYSFEFVFSISFVFFFREQRIKEEKARLEHERQALKDAEPYVSN